MHRYFTKTTEVLEAVVATQQASVLAAARLVADAVMSGGAIFYFGCGHSHMLAEEMEYRGGGLMIAHALLEPSLMLHENVLKGAALENLSGYARAILESSKTKAGDVLVVISNSGRNQVPVEMAQEARARGLRVIALTSLAYSRTLTPRPTLGKRLFEVADVVLDNCGLPGDAALDVDGFEARVGPTSTIAGAFLLNAVTIEAIGLLLQQGITPPVFMSASLPEAHEWNTRLSHEWRERVRY